MVWPPEHLAIMCAGIDMMDCVLRRALRVTPASIPAKPRAIKNARYARINGHRSELLLQRLPRYSRAYLRHLFARRTHRGDPAPHQCPLYLDIMHQIARLLSWNLANFSSELHARYAAAA